MVRSARQIALVLFTVLPFLNCSAISAPSAMPLPGLSGMWGRNSFDFEPLLSGPGPVMNVRRLPNGAIDQAVSVGDYRNPILKPESAEVVRKRGEVSLSGRTFADTSNQCRSYPPPYSHSIALQLQILQRPGEVLIMYPQDQGVRHVRINQPHPVDVAPSWYGDSVGRYEGDTLIVDTIGFKVGPQSMVDRYGTPHSKALHLIERFRLIDGGAAKEAIAAHEKEYGRIGGPPGIVKVDPGFDQGLQVSFTVEDPEMFTTPWSASVTDPRVTDEWVEYICAENPTQYFGGSESAIPQSNNPDF